jgi:hypothetical protein
MNGFLPGATPFGLAVAAPSHGCLLLFVEEADCIFYNSSDQSPAAMRYSG